MKGLEQTLRSSEVLRRILTASRQMLTTQLRILTGEFPGLQSFSGPAGGEAGVRGRLAPAA